MHHMGTLYVTDLDGTLLRPDGSLGRRTLTVVNAFIASGGLITDATARSFHSMPGSSRGAWCGTKAGLDATHWWAVMVGQKPASLMVMTGGDEGVGHGLVPAPPQVS